METPTSSNHADDVIVEGLLRRIHGLFLSLMHPPAGSRPSNYVENQVSRLEAYAPSNFMKGLLKPVSKGADSARGLSVSVVSFSSRGFVVASQISQQPQLALWLCVIREVLSSWFLASTTVTKILQYTVKSQCVYNAPENTTIRAGWY